MQFVIIYKGYINIAIDSCPVDCIHYVKENNLPILEYAMAKCNRVSVASMMSGSVRVDDPFDVANQMVRSGEERYGRTNGGNYNPDFEFRNGDLSSPLEGRLKKRIREAWLKLGEKPRMAWMSYKKFRRFGSEDEDFSEAVAAKKTKTQKKKSRWVNFM